MCCGNASGNLKVKFDMIGNGGGGGRSFKGTKANCIPVHYYNQKRARMDRKVFEN
jgi:hypothetical protein